MYYCNEANPKKKERKIAAGNIVASLITHFVEKSGYDLQKFKSLFKPGKVIGDNNQTYSINNRVITITHSYQKLPDILQKILYFPAKTQNEENSLDEDSKRINELVKSELILQFHYVEGGKGKEFMKKLVGGDDKIYTEDSIWKTCVDPTKNPRFQLNRIIFGAPGTGKSYQANLDANELLLGERKEDKALDTEEKENKAAHLERVTFHPEYSYYDFVGSYKPVMKNVQVEGKDAAERKIEYDFVPGPFTRILVKALKDKEHPYLLLIEEINRARVAAVFGDIFQLLDRTKGGESEYSICLSEDLKEHLKEQGLPLNELMLPPNLYIWATMNSADQGVYPLDTAFKRRWSMEYLDIDSGKEEDDWNQIRTGINKLLIEKGHVNEDKLMGYYFLKAEERDTEDHLKEALAGKVLMYLFDDAAKPCRKDIFKEINKARIYSDLRVKLSLSEPNLGIFDGAVFWPGKNTTTGSDQDNAAPKAEEAEPVDNQQ